MRDAFPRNSPIALAISIAMLGAGGSVTPFAQAQESLIEEVVVTARKRQESLQDVPVAVTALTPNQIERGSIQRTTDIDKMVPNAGQSRSASSRNGVTESDLREISAAFRAASSRAAFSAASFRACSSARRRASSSARLRAASASA